MKFFKAKSGNWVCPVDGGLIVAKGTMTPKEIEKALATGEARQLDTNILVGFGGEEIEVSGNKVVARKSTPAADVTIELVD